MEGVQGDIVIGHDDALEAVGEVEAEVALAAGDERSGSYERGPEAKELDALIQTNRY